MIRKFITASVLFATVSAVAFNAVAAASSRGNTTNESYVEAKRTLEKKVYYDHRVTLYCEATFDRRKNISLPSGFKTPSDEGRARRVEWEHVVPAENFGREFLEWKYGSDACFDGGEAFRGRSCAERSNREFRLMHADMYNLFPSIGAVNKLRANYPYTEFDKNIRSTFGSCSMKIYRGKAEPPENARGEIARAMLYMRWAYPERVKLKAKYLSLMEDWNARYPVTTWECTRAKRIERLQGNANPFVKDPCERLGRY